MLVWQGCVAPGEGREGIAANEWEKIRMSASEILHPHQPEFERFLYASVGEDRNGYVVTVLSTLTRLNLDPWKEAAELAALGQEAARSRLGLLLSRFRDVPALGQDHGSVARDLTRLLPERPARAAGRVGGSVPKGQFASAAAIWTVITIVMALMQLVFAGTSGIGE